MVGVLAVDCDRLGAELAAVATSVGRSDRGRRVACVAVVGWAVGDALATSAGEAAAVGALVGDCLPTAVEVAEIASAAALPVLAATGVAAEVTVGCVLGDGRVRVNVAAAVGDGVMVGESFDCRCAVCVALGCVVGVGDGTAESSFG